MNDYQDGSAGPGTSDLGWLVRCKNGCDGIVHSSVPRIGDPCPLCTSEPAKKSIITYCVKIAAAGETHEQISMEGGISFDGDVVQSWDVDLGTFVTSADWKTVMQRPYSNQMYPSRTIVCGPKALMKKVTC